MRQRVRASYAHTVMGTEPSSGRHVVHNGYVVTVEASLDGAPEDERNPFDAMEWWEVEAALSELPESQAELLATIIERMRSGWSFEDAPSLDDLFEETLPAPSPAAVSSVPAKTLALVRVAARMGAYGALGEEPLLNAEISSALSQGWSATEVEQFVELAYEAGFAVGLECAPTGEIEE